MKFHCIVRWSCFIRNRRSVWWGGCGFMWDQEWSLQLEIFGSKWFWYWVWLCSAQCWSLESLSEFSISWHHLRDRDAYMICSVFGCTCVAGLMYVHLHLLCWMDGWTWLCCDLEVKRSPVYSIKFHFCYYPLVCISSLGALGHNFVCLFTFPSNFLWSCLSVNHQSTQRTHLEFVLHAPYITENILRFHTTCNNCILRGP